MRYLLATTILAGLTAFAPAGVNQAAASELKVVASFSIIGDMARRVGGDRIDLVTLVGPNGDAHVYEPRPADAVAMAGADVVLANGLHFEGFLSRLAEASGSVAPVVELTNGVETIATEDDDHDHEAGEEAQAGSEADHDHDHDHETEHADTAEDDHHDHGPVDPHAFQSVPNARIYVRNIAEAFCGVDPEGCGIYQANAADYTEELDALDADIRETVTSIPEDRRTIITSHDAFGYFGKEYGIRFLAPEGISTDAEASAADVAALIRQVREDEAAAIFVENITNARLIEQIASETGLQIGGTLYSDALSGPDAPASTYVEMMRHNIETIARAIEGS